MKLLINAPNNYAVRDQRTASMAAGEFMSEDWIVPTDENLATRVRVHAGLYPLIRFYIHRDHKGLS